MSASSPAPQSQRQQPLLSNTTYDVIKHVVTLFLPAAAALYFGLAQIWHFPKTTEVVGTIAALNTFLGVIMGLSTMSYNSSDSKYVGSINGQLDPATGVTTYSLDLNIHPDTLINQKDVSFKVNANGN